MYLVIQEGGSSAELYPHLFDRRREAEVYRVACAKEGAYRTTPLIKVPARLAKTIREHSEFERVFNMLLSDALDALDDLDMPDTEGSVT